MEITVNSIAHIGGPALWVLFLVLIAWYTVRGALSERAEVTSVRDLGEATLDPAAGRRPRRRFGRDLAARRTARREARERTASVRGSRSS